MFLDSDDWLELDACELAYNEISQGKYDFVKFAHYTYNEKTKKTSNNVKEINRFINNLKNNDLRKSNYDFINAAYSCMHIYNKNFLIENDIKYAKLRVC